VVKNHENDAYSTQSVDKGITLVHKRLLFSNFPLKMGKNRCKTA